MDKTIFHGRLFELLSLSVGAVGGGTVHKNTPPHRARGARGARRLPRTASSNTSEFPGEALSAFWEAVGVERSWKIDLLQRVLVHLLQGTSHTGSFSTLPELPVPFKGRPADLWVEGSSSSPPS